jgi:hypothetical protein
MSDSTNVLRCADPMPAVIGEAIHKAELAVCSAMVAHQQSTRIFSKAEAA